MRPDPCEDDLQLKVFIDDYISGKSRNIFGFFASLLSPERARIITNLDITTKEIENSYHSFRNDCLIYARRLICGTQFKKMRNYVDAAYSLEGAGKAAYFFEVHAECPGDAKIWYRRAGQLRESAFRLFRFDLKLVDAAYALGHSSAAYWKAGEIIKARDLSERAVKLFEELDKVPSNGLREEIHKILS